MEMFDSFCTLVGIAGVAIGLLELFSKKLIGRKLEGVSAEKQRKFLPYDVATYLVCGGLMALLGLGEKLPFMKTGAAVIICIAVSVSMVALNAYFGNKILGAPKQEYKGERLR